MLPTAQNGIYSRDPYHRDRNAPPATVLTPPGFLGVLERRFTFLGLSANLHVWPGGECTAVS